MPQNNQPQFNNPQQSVPQYPNQPQNFQNVNPPVRPVASPAPKNRFRIPPMQIANMKLPEPVEKVGENIKANFFQPVVDYFFSDPTKQKVLASTQDHLDIYDIKNNLILLKNGDIAMVIETTAVNFQLLSTYEQDQKIGAFSDLINSLNFEIQVVIHTEPIDMRRYLNYLEESYRKIPREDLRKQMRVYIDYVKDLVVMNNVLQKRFFLIIPHRSGVISADQVNPFQKIIDVILGRRRVIEMKNADRLFEKAIVQLVPKRDSIMKMLSRMGLGSKQLNTRELTNLFYSYYNPTDNF